MVFFYNWFLLEFLEKKNQLLILVVVNFAASAINLAYEILNRIFLSSENCDEFFDSEDSNTALYLIQRILVLLVPLLALLIVFYNWRKVKQSNTLNPTYSVFLVSVVFLDHF